MPVSGESSESRPVKASTNPAQSVRPVKSTAEDAIEMILAGATAVSVGTANFYHPHATEEIVDGIRAYMERYQVEDIRELIGAVHDR